ncbi:MAG: siphovirus Gp157 family protein [Candidatus Marinimicrobia bacterium]|jgi:hypothetical protein|nr:siphovirus Gp157 family protein [Candidatus Neomarinimicrobiota bacterium]
MTALYEIARDHQIALDEMLQIEDLPADVLHDTMEALTGEFEAKGLSVAACCKNLDADIDALKGVEHIMAAKRKVLENRVAWMKNYLLGNMIETGIHVISCPEFKISVKNNPPAVVIIDEALIPEDFKAYVETIKIDKIAIKRAGGCPGIELVSGKSLSIK